MRPSANLDLATLVPNAARAMSTGMILVEMGKLTPADVETVLRLQGEKDLRFGEAALALGLINERDMQQVLFQQFGHFSPQPEDPPYPPALVAAQRPFGDIHPNVEALCAIRTQLMLLWFSRGKKALSIAGLDADEDSRFLAANLAILFSQLGENTLLVDTNLRDPRQHEIFGMKQGLGLSDILSKRAGLEMIVPIAHFDKLSLLTAGTVPPNPQELVGSAVFTALYEILAHRYDVILYDVAPLKLGADAFSVAATTSGGMLMAVCRDDARAADIHAMNSRLGASGVDIVGAVLLKS